MELTSEELIYIEQTARIFNASGDTLTEGKIIAFLLISEEQCISFDQIMATLKISKGNTSQSIQNLLNKGLIEKCVIPFERKSFYTLTNPDSLSILDNRIKMVEITRNVFIEAKEINKKYKRNSKEILINQLIDFNTFIYEELIQLKEKWRLHENSTNSSR
jgi:DNA-binding transcriptional regulator GbsR (MarR family)